MKIGYHIRRHDRNLSRAIKEDKKIAKEYGVNISAIQIFVIGPNDSKEILTDSDTKYLKKLSNDIDIFVHGSHLDHILGKKYHYTKMNIRREIEISKNIGAKGLVIHIPSKNPEDVLDAFEDIIDNGKYLSDLTVYFEINTYKSNSEYNYANPDILLKYFSIILNKSYSKMIGLVIDTAHLWSSGINIRTYEDAKEYLSSINNLIKVLTPNILVHLNDQKWEFGSGSDEHMPLTKGTIWNEYGNKKMLNVKDSGLAAFIDWAEKNNFTLMLERRKQEEIAEDLLFLSSHFSI